MRTYEQTMEIVRECQRIEKAGGDVLEYVRVTWPSYSPRATWYSIQRQFLGRRPDQFTEGRPKKDGKEGNRMGKMEQTARGLVLCKETGKDIRQFLLDNGYSDPCTALSQVKYWMKTHDPDLYDQIKDLSLRKTGGRIKAGELNLNMGDNAPELLPPKQPTETVDIPDKFGGVKHIKLYGNPEPMELHVCAVQSRLIMRSKYESCRSPEGAGELFMSFVWRDPVTHSEQFLTMSVSQWELMVMEIPQALRQLHLKA